MDAFTALTQFVNDYPIWHLVEQDTDFYMLTANQAPQQLMFDLDPDNPDAVFRPGPYMHFFLSNLGNVTYDGKTLSFKTRGYTYQCSGGDQTIVVSKQ